MKNKGFTLIELMIVVVIIGILSAIVVPRLINRTKDAEIGATKASITSISLGLKMYELDNGKFPTTEEGLKALVEKPSSTAPDKWKGPYLEQELIDAWKHPFQYRCPSQNNHPDFDVWSFGPDGNDGTDDDIVNWKKK